jgi:hypothetical protein
MEMQDISEWASPDLKQIEVYSPGFGDGTFKIEVREFVPVEGDLLEKVWSKNGEKRTYKIPAYGITNLKKAAERIKEYLDDNVSKFIESSISVEKDLIWYTYWMALQRANNALVRFPFALLVEAFPNAC